MGRPRTSGVANAKKPKTRRLNARLDDDSYELLHVHCFKERIDPGDYLAKLIKAGCTKWACKRADKDNDRQESSDNVNTNASIPSPADAPAPIIPIAHPRPAPRAAAG